MALLALVCCRPSPSPDGEADQQESAAPHEDEPAHPEIPTRVRLSETVVRDAKIRWVPASTRAIARTTRLPGEIVPDPERRARIAARLPGVVESVAVEPGARVTKGQVIATVRAPDVQSLRSEAASLRARATSARANAQRLAELAKTRMASQQETIAAQAEADALEAQARGARDRLRAIGLGRSSGKQAILFDVKSPIDGVLVERNVVDGDPVVADTVIGSVVALDRVWFLARVFERDLSLVQEGAHARVRLNALPALELDGEVTYLAHQVDPGARTVTARIPVDNVDGSVRLGLYGMADIAVGPPEGESVLAVPRSAVTEMLGQSVVFVHQPDGDFERHDVQLGRADLEYVEILHGLRDGEEVVVEGAFTVKSVLLRSTFAEEEE
jgi:cobalt-zinc-cadmium efflux system membrane fusion protein